MVCRCGGGRGAGLPGRRGHGGRVAGGASQPLHGTGLAPQAVHRYVSVRINFSFLTLTSYAFLPRLIPITSRAVLSVIPNTYFLPVGLSSSILQALIFTIASLCHLLFFFYSQVHIPITKFLDLAS